jgi:small-conductance mechanosensitive channel
MPVDATRHRVTDINLVYTTLQEIDDAGDPRGSVLRVPNSLFFQRSVRRWRSDEDRRRALAARDRPTHNLDV